MVGTVPTTDAGRLALARYGCELERDDGPPCSGAPVAYRILAALAGIPEENADNPDPSRIGGQLGRPSGRLFFCREPSPFR
jgi:hypothetical protein